MPRRVYIGGLIVLVASLLSSLLSVRVKASAAVLIAGLQTGSVTSADAEYVRLASTTNAAIDLTGWRLQYQSATGTTWTTKATLKDPLGAGTTLLVATSVYQTTEPHQVLTAGLTQAGGHIQLIDKTNAVQDLLGWGTAAHANGAAAMAPQPDQALLRKTDNAGYIDTANNLTDFEPTPIAVTPPTTTPVPPAENLYPPIINELLPNPAAPKTDDKDEFIELFNPNPVPFILKGYKLQTGAKYSYSLTFDDDVLPPSGYGIFTSGASSLTLSNTAGTARLLDPSGSTVSESDSYSVAAEGAAWALIDGGWQWTTTPTPNAANVLTGPGGTTSPAQTTSPKSTASTKSKTAAVKGAKTTKASSAKTAAKSSSTAPSFTAETKKPSPLHPLILAGVGALAVTYGIYEYRHDLKNLVYKFRRNRATRRADRKTA